MKSGIENTRLATLVFLYSKSEFPLTEGLVAAGVDEVVPARFRGGLSRPGAEPGTGAERRGEGGVKVLEMVAGGT